MSEDMILDFTRTKELLCFVADKIIDNRQYLCDLDAKTGDGDHGIGMSNGMQKAKAKISGMDDNGNIYELFKEFGKAMLMSMGGVSGVIFGSLFLGGANEMPPDEAMTAGDFALMMEKSLSVIKTRGKAEVGDKTMVDALSPAVEAMNRSISEGFAVMLKNASDAAKTGMESTVGMQAKAGRAKSLLERSAGHQDAGATSVYLIFLSMYEFLNN